MPKVVTLDAATSTVSVFPASIEDNGSETATITVRVLNTDGNPMAGLAAARITISSTGSGNTIAALSGVTDRNGEISTTMTSTVGATKTISATVCGAAITDTASLVVQTAGGTVATFTDISRDASSTAGGDTVLLTVSTISGTPAVRFNGVLATSITTVNPTTISCVVPASLSAGVVEVVCGGVSLTNPRAAKIGGDFEYLPAATTTFAESDFDSGSLSPFTASAGAGGSTTATTTEPYSGTHSVESEYDASTGSASLYYQFTGTTNPMLAETNGVYARWYLNVPTATITSITGSLRQIKLHFCRITTGSGQPGWLVLGIGTVFGGNNLQAVIDNGAQLITGGDTGLAMGDGIWREIVVYMNRKSGTGASAMWIDGKLQFRVSSADMGSDTSSDIYRCRIGIGYQEVPGGPTTVFTDDYWLGNGFPHPVVP